MPTVIALDVSLSMRRVVLASGANDTLPNEQLTRHHLAVHGINALLHYLQVNSKLEFVSLVSLISYDKYSTMNKYILYMYICVYIFFLILTCPDFVFVVVRSDLSFYSGL